MKICNYHSNSTSFKSANVHIIDGGAHADNMKHFAKAVFKDAKEAINIKMHDVEVNKIEPNSKQLSSLEETLKELNRSDKIKAGDYAAFLGIVTVPLLNLRDRIEYVLWQRHNLTPQNIKDHKTMLLDVFKKVYDSKDFFAQQISYMDNLSQGIGNVFGVIREINKLVQKGVKFYIPAGHGYDTSVKWMAENRNLKPEMYRFMSKGLDTNNQIHNIFEDAERENLYDFNLLSLSDAKIVNVLGKDNNDYIFSAKDRFVNESARGVYNFSPVRNAAGDILGYSYHDTTTVEYPYENFCANDKIANICRYVGLKLRDFLADSKDINQFKYFLKNRKKSSDLPDKLYPIREVFDESDIRRRKLDVLGDFVNKNSLVFDSNRDGEILFQKCNCEGSDKPSVLQMWGACFATINAIKKDILRKAE